MTRPTGPDREDVDDRQEHGRPDLADPLEEGGPARVGPGLRGEAAEGQLDQDDDRGDGQDLVAEGQVGEPAHGVLQAQVAEAPPDNSLLILGGRGRLGQSRRGL